MKLESEVAQHYGVEGLLERILAGLEATGADVRHLQPEDLSSFDEFHVGGHEATVHAVKRMSLSEDQQVLDVGCGIGGAARYIASEVACRVAGIDLTPAYIQIAQTLTHRVGLDDKAAFEVASALAMPFEDETFDAAFTFHVAMNIRDREGLYREIARVMKPGATFCVYDVMKKNEEALTFPVPWAPSEYTSHLTTVDEMRTLLNDAGFEVEEVEDRTEFAQAFFRQKAAAVVDGPQPLGLEALMGPSMPEKFRNVVKNMGDERIVVVQLIATRKT